MEWRGDLDNFGRGLPTVLRNGSTTRHRCDVIVLAAHKGKGKQRLKFGGK